MKEREQGFTREAINQQTTGTSDELAPAESRLVQQIYELSQAYAWENEQSLEHIWTRLRQSQELSSHREQYFAKGKTMQNQDRQPMDISEPSTLSQPASIPRKTRRTFTLVAALLVALLLLGSALAIFANVHQPGASLANGYTATSTPKATQMPATTFIPFPAQDCPKEPVDASQSWYQLCKAGKFVSINQTRPLKHGQSATIKAAYADRNQLFLICDIGPAQETDRGCLFWSVTTAQGVQLKEESTIGGSTQKQNQMTVIDYDTSDLSTASETLTIRVNAMITTDSPGKVYQVDFSSFSLPLYGAQFFTPNQTITRGGVTFTLTKMVIGASGVRFVIQAPHMPFNIYNNGFDAILQTGKQKIIYPNYSLLGGNQPTGFEFLFNNDLTDELGAWTLTVAQGHAPTIPPPSGIKPLVFHFVV